MSELEKKNSYDYSKYDEMSTEALEELLRLDFQMSEEAESDINAILYISEVIAKREKNPPDVEAAWERFNTKYRPYAKDGRSLYDFDDEDDVPEAAPTNSAVKNERRTFNAVPQRRHWRGARQMVRLSVIMAIMAVFLFVTSATAYALGYDLWGAILQWTKETFSFVSPANNGNYADLDPVNTVNSPGQQEYASLQEALDAYGITEPLLPTWIPEGFTVKTVTVHEDTKPGCVVFSMSYVHKDKWLTIQINMYHDSDNVGYTTWQKDEVDITTLNVDGQVYYLTENTGRWTTSWTTGVFECNITGDVSLDELTEIIESISRKDE